MISDTAYLLLNLGTPDSPSPKDVRKYLAEFLMDPRVIDISPVARFLLVYGIILNTRPKKSADAYRQIWTDRGSPLKFHTEDLTEAVSKILPNVFYTMRYGNPSIASRLSELRSFARIRVLPLYPQYAWSSTVSSIEKVKEEAARLGISDRIEFLGPFYKDPGYQRALAARVKATLREFPADHVLVSYHGLPERQLEKASPNYRAEGPQHCLTQSLCCETPNPMHSFCYRHQSFQTTRLLAEALEWKPDFYSISFQSRLGRTPWIQPFTDFRVRELSQDKRIKRLAVVCPSFVADCLETLEEIGMRAKAEFELLNPGGELRLIPCLNEDTLWVEGLAAYLSKGSPWESSLT